MSTRLLSAATVLITAPSLHAATITLGDQDYNEGDLVAGAVGFVLDSIGEPAPFDTIYGSDETDAPQPLLMFTFDSIAAPVAIASITVGIVDGDSLAPGSQLALFSVDGVDLTALLDAELESNQGDQAECNIYTIDLTGAALDALNDGAATFSIQMKGPSLIDFNGGTVVRLGNGVGLDFALLKFESVPTPTAATPLLIAGLLARRRRLVASR